MSEYIERKALLDELQEELDFETPMYTAEQNKWINAGLRIAVRDVKRQLTADVVQVVRCKDCTSYGGTGWCCEHDTCMEENDFCSYGERREGE